MSQNRSRDDFLRFLDYLGEKGLIPSATAASRKATANKVTSILSDEEALDVTALDLDALMTRFHNLNAQQYTPESLQTYRSRMKTALDDFRAYSENPLGFKPSGQSRSKPRQNSDKPKPLLASTSTKPAVGYSNSAPSPTLPNVSVLPIPLRSDLTVQIAGLPFDLTKSEAQKLANIILAHALPDA